MTHRMIAWTVLAWSLASVTAVAQQAERKGPSTQFVGFVDSGTVEAQDLHRQQKMYEDIEIMRRLLDRTLRTMPGVASTQRAGVAYVDFDGDGYPDLYVVNNQDAAGVLYHNKGDSTFTNVDASFARIGQPSDAVVAQSTQAHDRWHRGPWRHDAVNAEGVYLPNQGVVYSVTLPVHFWQPATKAAQPARKPLTDWERTRKELVGEKIEPEEKAASPREASLADRVLKLLFDNGRHFGQLGVKENLTVALTLRADSAQCVACHQNPWKPAAAQSATERGLQWLATHQQSSDAQGKPSQPGSGTASAVQALMTAGAVSQYPRVRDDGIVKAKTEAHKQALLGDLHMKQGQPAEAVEAYRKAGQLQADVAKLQFREAQVSGEKSKPDLKAHLESMELATKLAQALLATGRGDEAQKIIDGLIVSSALKAAVKGDAGPKPADAAPKIELPNKLIVSAPKALLDQVGTGKITFEEFKKAVSVQYVTFPTVNKEPPKPTSAPAGVKKGN